MEEQKITDNSMIRFSTISAMIIIWGVYIFWEYHIDFDLFSELMSNIDSFTQMRIFLSDPGIFYERLVTNKTFLEIFKEPELYMTIYLVLSLCAADYFTGFVNYISQYRKVEPKTSLIKIYILALNYINAFFIGFITNYLLVFLFEKISIIPKIFSQMWNALVMGSIGYMPFVEGKPAIIQIIAWISTVITLFGVMAGIWCLIMKKIGVRLFKYLIILIIMVLVDTSSWPIYVPILITATLRIAFDPIESE